MTETAHLTPALATSIFVLGVVAGYQYRRNWKAEGPAWKAWVYGLVAASSLITVAFVPVRGG
ncbi:MAG: hypothetical protein HRU11_03865 [Parvularculaceae bacterium]|nr:hypothetical protein [Parvularculaceae bacterium]